MTTEQETQLTLRLPKWDNEKFFAEIDRSQAQALWGYDHFRLWMDWNDEHDTYYVPGGMVVYYGAAPFYVYLVDVPDTLSGDILRGRRDLPRYDCHLKIIGDEVTEVEFEAPLQLREDDDSRFSEKLNEDAKDLLDTLLVIMYDESLHFAKPARTRREIEVLLKCRGSPHVVQLLGRTWDDRLVFPLHKKPFVAAARAGRSIANIRKWMLGIVDGLSAIHAAGHTYRDFRLDNLLDHDPVILIDLECTLATTVCMAPELAVKGVPADTDYNIATDMYGLGHLLQVICYSNNPRSRYIEWPVPPPFEKIFEACTQHDPKLRPALAQVRTMLEDIGV
ncbi:hypothetical protein CERSUDRAFT_113173 [Gelatoporia subvermispora B]|uniref:Protein kinase domain-containing protein n=1 Tax=Ceriporiopsis subvermispora (strain B) TaxID=914234 RepID=M2R0K4_CERS8|nr:hypothetical protein CERSUDRAFT_113173 [Gelatoporia subvermispora B]